MVADDDLHRPGTPCWVVLVTPDAARTGPFYAGLFGWSAPPASGGFATIECDERDVAGVLQLPAEAADAGAASRWLIYFATDDAARSLEAIRPAGGEILTPSFDVGDLGHGCCQQGLVCVRPASITPCTAPPCRDRGRSRTRLLTDTFVALRMTGWRTSRRSPFCRIPSGGGCTST